MVSKKGNLCNNGTNAHRRISTRKKWSSLVENERGERERRADSIRAGIEKRLKKEKKNANEDKVQINRGRNKSGAAKSNSTT